MYITEALLTVCIVLGSSKALTVPSTNAINHPSLLLPPSNHHINTTTTNPDPPFPWPWPILNTPIKLISGWQEPGAMMFTSYGRTLPEKYTEPTLQALDHFWVQFSPYFPVRNVGEPPETLVNGNVTLHVVSFDWYLGSYMVDDLIYKTIKYVQSNGARDVAGVIGPIDDEGKIEVKSAFKIVID